MTDYTPDAPLQLADVQWSVCTSVSMQVTGAPGIMAPCGHLLQPLALVVTYTRGSLPSLTRDWSPEGWDLMVSHPAEGGLGEMELTLPSKAFGEVGSGFMPVSDRMRQMADAMGIPLPDREDLLGPVPEWIETAIKSYEPYTTDDVPVRLDATYHG